MRVDNIEIMLKIPLPEDEKDDNRIKYSKKALTNAIWKLNNSAFSIPLEVENALGVGQIGLVDKTKYEKDENGTYLLVHGLVFHGGTVENAISEDGSQVDEMEILSVGFALE